ncbi:MAG TPA: hypothetical protein VFD59_16395 [Nocardioidaceae bacterium]|nr:hypothetical protein [Nocardioidaceae bacterium]
MSRAPRYKGPAELTVRVSSVDEAFVRRLYGLARGSRPAPGLPDRLVVDAHVPLAANGPALPATAREAGVPFLIDPETIYLQDLQHPSATWCRVPYAVPAVQTPADLGNQAAQDALIKGVVDYQVEHGATAVIAPYLHIERPDSGWIPIQASLWRRTKAHATASGIHLPVIAVVALGWRCLHPLQGLPHLSDMWDALAALEPSEVALAASKVHMGARPEDRIAELLMLVRHLTRTYKVTMWQQGLLGEACVIEGAAGYECGIGWREKCDLQTRMSQHRHPTTATPPHALSTSPSSAAASPRPACNWPGGNARSGHDWCARSPTAACPRATTCSEMLGGTA